MTPSVLSTVPLLPRRTRRGDDRRLKAGLACAALALTLSLVAAAPAGAGDTQCSGSSQGGSVFFSGTYDDVVVPPGETCFLLGATVRGNVTGSEDAVLAVFSSQVDGNVIGDKADVVVVRDSTVGGDITVKDGGPHPAFIEVDVSRNRIPNGNVHIQGMTGSVAVGFFTSGGNVVAKGDIRVEDNTILPGHVLHVQGNGAKGVQVLRNTGSGTKSLILNRVAGVLQCWENDLPLVGGPNVAGRAEGQCFATADVTPPVLQLPSGVVVDATGPDGATVTYTVTAIDAVDLSPTVACSPTSGSVFPIATTTVTCTATDGAGNSASATFLIHVKGATEQVDDVIDRVEAMSLEPQGIEQSLLAKLEAALDALAAGDIAGACDSLQSFINHAEAQRDKKLTEAQANTLVEAATRIRAVLGC